MSRLSEFRQRQKDAGLLRMEFWLTPAALDRLGELRVKHGGSMSETLNQLLTTEHKAPTTHDRPKSPPTPLRWG